MREETNEPDPRAIDASAEGEGHDRGAEGRDQNHRGADTLVEEAARTMLYLELKRVFVVDDGELVGVLSQADIADAVATAKI